VSLLAPPHSKSTTIQKSAIVKTIAQIQLWSFAVFKNCKMNFVLASAKLTFAKATQLANPLKI
jgi:hypothetical protein